jgi:outer membrane protein TolC
MTLTTLAAAFVLTAAANAPVRLTFDQALAIAQQAPPAASDAAFASEVERLRRSRIPDLRIEGNADSSRTVHPFTADPLQSDFISSIVALDYPLWDGGARRGRFDAAAARARRFSGPRGLDDTRLTQLIAAYGDLYLAQRSASLLRRTSARLQSAAAESVRLLESGDINNATAAQRQDLAINYATALADFEARRADAAARLLPLLGLDAEPQLTTLSTPPAAPAPADGVAPADPIVAEREARMREVTAAAGFRATMSAFAGAAAARSEFQGVGSDGTLGVYGLRFNLTQPLFNRTSALAVAEARAELDEAIAQRDRTLSAAASRRASLQRAVKAGGRRIALTKRSVQQARLTAESMARLVAAGMRPETDQLFAEAETLRRSVDLLGAQVERWKAAQLLARTTN